MNGVSSEKECLGLHFLQNSDFEGKFVGKAEETLLQVVAKIRSSDLINSEPAILVDVGANIGLFTYLLCTIFPDGLIHSFEPGEEMRTWLTRKKMACPSPKNVIVHSKAVSDVDGESVVLYGPSKQKKYTSSNLKPHNTGASISSGVNARRGSTVILGKTKTVKLDTFFRDESNIDFIKIDAEGLDPLIINGLEQILQQNIVKIIYWEFGNHWKAASNHSLAGVVKKLEKFSYISYVVGFNKTVKISGKCLDVGILDNIFRTINVLSILKGSIYENVPNIILNGKV